jgi:hypothetical protein
VVDLSNHPIAVGMNIDAQLDASNSLFGASLRVSCGLGY